MKAVQITEPALEHGEGPVWSSTWGGLRCVDIPAGDVVTVDESSGGLTRHHVGTVAAAIRPRARGGMVVALEREFALVEPDDKSIRRLGELWSDPSVRMNDGGCDPDGRFYCGSMAYDAAPGRGRLYRLDPSGAASLVLEGVTISNGLGWSPDGSIAYYVDTPTQRIDVFTYDTEAGLTGRRPFVHIPPEAGAPDGLTVDAEGHVWVALWGGGAVHRYAPDGRLAGKVEVPVTKVTACALGGPKLDRLFITTMREGTDPTREPEAGALFRADVGVAGLPVAMFNG